MYEASIFLAGFAVCVATVLFLAWCWISEVENQIEDDEVVG